MGSGIFPETPQASRSPPEERLARTHRTHGKPVAFSLHRVSRTRGASLGEVSANLHPHRPLGDPPKPAGTIISPRPPPRTREAQGSRVTRPRSHSPGVGTGQSGLSGKLGLWAELRIRGRFRAGPHDFASVKYHQLPEEGTELWGAQAHPSPPPPGPPQSPRSWVLGLLRVLFPDASLTLWASLAWCFTLELHRAAGLRTTLEGSLALN